jgi:integrase
MEKLMSRSHPSANVPWNCGKLIGQKPPLKIKEVWAIRVRLQLASRPRDLALFNFAIDSKLRGCDVVKVGIEDVLLSGSVRSRASVVQQKTGKPVTFEISDQTKLSIQEWVRRLGSRQRGPLFPSRIDPNRSISTRQYARLVDRWIGSIGLDPSVYGTHSLRRTKATLIYRRTGNIRAVQLLLGHAKLESTVRYLGIEVEDALAIAEQVDV